jgi:hypothetical protein
MRNTDADRLALLDELHNSEAAYHEQKDYMRMTRSAMVEAEAEIQLLRAMLVDAEARVQSVETAAAAAPHPKDLEAAGLRVRLIR